MSTVTLQPAIDGNNLREIASGDPARRVHVLEHVDGRRLVIGEHGDGTVTGFSVPAGDTDDQQTITAIQKTAAAIGQPIPDGTAGPDRAFAAPPKLRPGFAITEQDRPNWRITTDGHLRAASGRMRAVRIRTHRDTFDRLVYLPGEGGTETGYFVPAIAPLGVPQPDQALTDRAIGALALRVSQ